MSEQMPPEELWDLYGRSLLALARTLLGDESAAQRAVCSGLATLYADHDGPNVTHALRTSARYVFAHSEAIRCQSVLVTWEPTSISATPHPRRLALNQRRMLALCIYGGHTYRDAAAAIGISEDTATRLITSALKHGRRHIV